MGISLTLMPFGVGRDPAAGIPVTRSPYTIGRSVSNDLHLCHQEVSGRHAVVKFHQGAWWLADEGSTNGTFVNGKRCSYPVELNHNDVIHFGTRKYVVSLAGSEAPGVATVQIDALQMGAAAEVLAAVNDGRCYALFQSIHRASDLRVFGYEALGRVKLLGAPQDVGKLFEAASRLGLTRELGHSFRNAMAECLSCGVCWPRDSISTVFVNVHPDELSRRQVRAVLAKLRDVVCRSGARVVIEIPESYGAAAARDIPIEELSQLIREHEMMVAFDDFGVGQARIADLLAHPPDFLKFDRMFVQTVEVDDGRRQFMSVVTQACRRLGVSTIAEGVENAADIPLLRDLGVDFVQGFVLSRPDAAHTNFKIPPSSLPGDCQHVLLGLSQKA